jgi:hypothetical protein
MTNRSAVAPTWLRQVGLAASMIGIGIGIGAVINPGVGPARDSTGAVTLRAAQPAGDPDDTPPEGDGRSGDQPSLSGGALWYPWAPGPGELGAAPMAFSVDHLIGNRTAKRVIASWGRNEDSPTAPLVNTRAIGEDNGQIFKPYDALPSTFTGVATTRLRNGDILSASFVPGTAPAPNRIGFPMAKSTDVAKSWTTWTAPLIENKWKLAWYRVHRDLLELADGTLLLGGYGKGVINGVDKEYSLVFESSDGGKTFSQRSAVNAGSSYSTNELGFGRTADGRLIAMMRGSETVARPPSMPLTQAFSDDDGKTWTDVKPYVPPEGMPNNGIMPKFLLQANGQLLMTYGRPDNNVVVSHDGTGRTWDDGETLYARYPGDDPLRRWQGSSGNMDLTALNNGSSLAFGDTCHNIWFCREYGHDNKIWTRKVDALGAGVGKLDLATKVRDKIIKLDGNVIAPDDRFPEQRLEGAVDGSSEYRSAARLDRRQELIIELDRTYTLNRIGLMLAKGELNSAKVETSVDGKTWSKPVVRTGDRTDFAMRYHDLDEVEAKFVKITRDGRAPLTAITELELYASHLLTFENDAITTIPRTIKDARYALVADKGTVPGYDHSNARMVLIDADQAARASATIPAQEPAAGQHLGFGFEGYGYGSAAIWEILGRSGDGAEQVAYRLSLAPDWTANVMVVKAWDGKAWVEVGRTGSPVVPNKQWMSVTVDSTAEQTTVSINGKQLGSTKVRLAEVDTFTGFRAETGLNPEDVGNMEHSYDDIEIRPLG